MSPIIPPYQKFITRHVDVSWHSILEKALTTMDQSYLKNLLDTDDWLPGSNQIFNAFSLPLDSTRYILFGESPYPRAQSANGYAFWDAAVDTVWSDHGLSKAVNRATSLRNIMKMLLVADNKLAPHNTSKEEIIKLDKSNYISTLKDLFNNLNEHGVLLLNATPVLHQGKVKEDSRHWLVFVETLLKELQGRPIQLVLLGKIAQVINKLEVAAHFKQLQAEHPYNLSFIQNPTVVAFFKPLNLLQAEC